MNETVLQRSLSLQQSTTVTSKTEMVTMPNSEPTFVIAITRKHIKLTRYLSSIYLVAFSAWVVHHLSPIHDGGNNLQDPMRENRHHAESDDSYSTALDDRQFQNMLWIFIVVFLTWAHLTLAHIGSYGDETLNNGRTRILAVYFWSSGIYGISFASFQFIACASAS